MKQVELASGTLVDPPKTISLPGLLRDVFALQRMLSRYRNESMSIEVARAMASRVVTYFDDEVSYPFLVETLIQYKGGLMDEAFLQTLALQLVSRREELDRAPLTLYHKPIRSEWVALELIGTQETTWRDNERGIALELFALNGHPAGHTLTKKVPENWLNFLAYQVGFSRTRRYGFEPWTLIGVKFWGYLVPDAKADTLNFAAWFVTPAFVKMNREIIRLRTRFNPNTGVEKPECPQGHAETCDQCNEKEQVCLASIHRVWKG